MIKKLKNFLITTLLGGVIVILPIVILFAVVSWLFNFVTSLIQPLTDVLIARSDFKELIADGIVIAIILCVCFFVGMVVRTRLGRFLFIR